MPGREQSLVLGYHTVSSSWESSVAVRPEALRAQLEVVLDTGYAPVCFSEAVARPDRRTVAITFDDAFRAVLELAVPVLQELGFVATMFVPTRFADTGAELQWDGYGPSNRGTGRQMRPLSWADLRTLADLGWEIGSHTRDHPHLCRLDDAGLLEQLAGSRQACELGLGQPCTSLAYPYGEVDQRVRDAAATAGYTTAVALGPQWRRHDPLWWPRTGIYRGDDLDRFRFKLSALARTRGFGWAVTTARRVSTAR